MNIFKELRKSDPGESSQRPPHGISQFTLPSLQPFFWRGVKVGVLAVAILAASSLTLHKPGHAGALVRGVPQEKPAGIVSVNPSAPVYDPGFWTKENLAKPPYDVNPETIGPNCYSYAVQSPFLSWPGGSVNRGVLPPGGDSRKNTREEFDKEVRHLLAGAHFDDLEYAGLDPKPRPGKYLVAFYLLPPKDKITSDGDGFDYHFVRQDRTGWSHKPGQGDPTRKDSEGRDITDPGTNEFRVDGRRYQFICYLYAPEGGSMQNKPSGLQAELTKLRRLESAADRLAEGEQILARFEHKDSPQNVFYLKKDENGRWVRDNRYSLSSKIPYELSKYYDDKDNILLSPETADFKDAFGKPFVFKGYYAGPNGEVSPFKSENRKLYQHLMNRLVFP